MREVREVRKADLDADLALAAFYRVVDDAEGVAACASTATRGTRSPCTVVRCGERAMGCGAAKPRRLPLTGVSAWCALPVGDRRSAAGGKA